jgi:hypothetical protein
VDGHPTIRETGGKPLVELSERHELQEAPDAAGGRSDVGNPPASRAI